MNAACAIVKHAGPAYLCSVHSTFPKFISELPDFWKKILIRREGIFPKVVRLEK